MEQVKKTSTCRDNIQKQINQLLHIYHDMSSKYMYRKAPENRVTILPYNYYHNTAWEGGKLAYEIIIMTNAKDPLLREHD